MTLAVPASFFGSLRGGLLGPTLEQTEVEGCNALLDACAGWPLAWTAYALATAYHETAHTMQPIKEFGGAGYFFRMYDRDGNRPEVARRLGNTNSGDGVLYCGRGYVQITGRSNYAKASKVAGLDLVGQPSLAMRPDVAAKILRSGMSEGWFTSKKLGDYLQLGPANEAQFITCRKIINGADRAKDIAGYALKFQTALKAGGWA